MINIAVDGYAGSGKTSLVKLLAKKMDKNIKILDTGAIFRAFAYAYKDMGYGELDSSSIKSFVKSASLQVDFVGDEQHTYVNKKDLTDFLRDEQIGILASKIACFPEIRAKYLVVAQSFAKNNNCIMEGRDIGSVVMPNADVKFFLTAQQNIRAERRFGDLKKQNKAVDLENVINDLKERDDRDSNRGDSSLKTLPESVVVDNSNMSLEETADFCLGVIEKVLNPVSAINIAIDGYVCSGKSTIARALAKRLGFNVFDTGALYRGVACAFDYMKLDESKIDEKYIQKFAKQINVDIKFIDEVEHVYVNGIDYTNGLRTERISSLSAKISPFPCIRSKVLELQREYAREHNLVMEGRDIGSFVLPNAQFKFFCTADENVRAKRRYEDQKALGNDVVFETVLKELRERDYADMHREHGALVQLPDSIILDTTRASVPQSVDYCVKIIKEKYPDIVKK